MGKHALKPIPRDGVGQCISRFDVSGFLVSGPNEKFPEAQRDKKAPTRAGWARRGAIFHYDHAPSPSTSTTRNLLDLTPEHARQALVEWVAERGPAFLPGRADAATSMAGAGARAGNKPPIFRPRCERSWTKPSRCPAWHPTPSSSRPTAPGSISGACRTARRSSRCSFPPAAGGRCASRRRPGARSGAPSAPPAAWASAAT